MEEIFAIGLVIVAGYVLGIVGFFRTLWLSSRLRELEQRLAARAAEAPPAAAVAPGPAPEAPPAEAAAKAPQPVLPWMAPPAPPRPAEASAPAQPEAVAPEFAARAAEAAAEAAAPAAPAPARPSLEEQLTLRWGVWAGAVAIVFAGVFLIRYAIDQGWLTPPVRVGGGFVLGLALVAAAERLRRHPLAQRLAAGLNPSQVPPALAAAGVALCFGNVYAAYGVFDLIGAGIAFAALAAVAFAALALALLHGPLVAAVGLVSAFATPGLVATEEPSTLALFLYLLAVCAAALAVAGLRAWVWLAWTALGAGAGWGFLWLAWTGGFGNDADFAVALLYADALLAMALYLLPRAAFATLVGRRIAWGAVAVLALLLLVLADAARHGTAAVIASLVFAALTVAAGRREPRLDLVPALAVALAVALLLSWGVGVVPRPGEAAGVVEGRPAGYFPTPLLPGAVQPFLLALGLQAALFLGAGAAAVGRAPRAWRWAALAAAGPVLLLAAGFAKVRVFAVDAAWAAAALLLAAVLAALAARVLGARGRLRYLQAGGVLALGVVAAVALAVAMGLERFWLTSALAALLPATAWVAGAVRLPALRWAAAAVAPVVLVRLLLNWYVADYDFGTWPLLNWLLWAYGLPTACFWLAARWLARQRTDLLVAGLELGAVALGTALLVLELRHGFGGGKLVHAYRFPEAAAQGAALAVAAFALLLANRRAGSEALRIGWIALGGAATLHLLAGPLSTLNPLWVKEAVGAWPLVNWLAPGFAVPAVVTLLFALQPETGPGRVPAFPLRPALASGALVGGLVWLSIETRRWFQGPVMAYGRTSDAEFYAYSGVWLAYGGALLALGIRSGSRPLRFAALAMVTLTVCKAFLADMAALTGIWRVLSFLGLGLALMAIGWLYQRYVFPPHATAPVPAAPEGPAAGPA